MRIAGAGARSAAPPSASLPPSPPPSSSDEPRVAGSSPGSPPAGSPGRWPTGTAGAVGAPNGSCAPFEDGSGAPWPPSIAPVVLRSDADPGRSLFKPRCTRRIFTHSSRGEPRHHTRRGAPPEARCSEAPRWVGRWYRSRRAAPQRISLERGAARPRPHPRSPARRRTTARDTTRLGRSNRVIPRLARRTARRGDGRRRPPSSRDRPRPTPRPRPRSRAIA